MICYCCAVGPAGRITGSPKRVTGIVPTIRGFEGLPIGVPSPSTSGFASIGAAARAYPVKNTASSAQTSVAPTARRCKRMWISEKILILRFDLGAYIVLVGTGAIRN